MVHFSIFFLPFPRLICFSASTLPLLLHVWCFYLVVKDVSQSHVMSSLTIFCLCFNYFSTLQRRMIGWVWMTREKTFNVIKSKLKLRVTETETKFNDRKNSSYFFMKCSKLTRETWSRQRKIGVNRNVNFERVTLTEKVETPQALER